MRIRRDVAITIYCVVVVDGCVFEVFVYLVSVRGCVFLRFVGVPAGYFDVCFGFDGWIAIGHVLDFNFGLPLPGLARAGVDPTSASTGCRP